MSRAALVLLSWSLLGGLLLLLSWAFQSLSWAQIQALTQ
jgi:hypothetical protein